MGTASVANQQQGLSGGMLYQYIYVYMNAIVIMIIIDIITHGYSISPSSYKLLFT